MQFHGHYNNNEGYLSTYILPSSVPYCSSFWPALEPKTPLFFNRNKYVIVCEFTAEVVIRAFLIAYYV